MEILGFILLFCVGLILGTLGGGGSILSVPIMVYLFSLDAVMASAYSLFIVGVTSLIGCILKFRTQSVNYRTGFVFGIPSVIVIFITRNWIVPSIPEALVKTEAFQFTKHDLILSLFALFMILASLSLLFKKNKPEHIKTLYHGSYLMIMGSLVGLLSGMVGVGGGFLIIPALIYFTDLDFKTAVGTTLLIITINSLIGFMGDVFNHSINWEFLLSITGFAVLGILVASRATQKLPTYLLRTTFGWLILFVGAFILIKEAMLNY